ncbi:MAG: hypothetical protein ABW224_06360 [Kibdelosporangium sp.]
MGTGVVAAFEFAVFLVIEAALIFGEGPAVPWSGVVMVGLFLLASTGFTFRLGRVGVFTSDTGVRSRSVWRTWTIPWTDVKGFEIKPLPPGPGSALAAALRIHTLWIVLGKDLKVQTPMLIRVKSGFLPGRDTTSLADAVQRPMFAVGEWVGLIPSEETAQQALRKLRDAHLASV